MSKLDFADVRAVVKDQVVAPDFTTIAAVGERRHRRNLAAGAVLTVAAIVVAGGVLLTREPPAQQLRPAGFTAPPVDPIAGPLAATQATAAGKLVCNGVPVDNSQAYYVMTTASQCGRPGPTLLAHSIDAGKSWKVWQLPPGLEDASYRTGLVINAQTVLVRGLLTRDGGATWAKAPAAGATTQDVPGGRSVFNTSSGGGLTTFDPVTGQPHLLAHQPEGVNFPQATTDAIVPATDGSLWTVGETNHGQVVNVSRDRGHTWRSSVVDSRGGVTTSVASVDGQTAYALSSETASNGASTATVFRSTDGGVSWRQISRGDSLPTDTLQLATDGSLIGAWTKQQITITLTPTRKKYGEGRSLSELRMSKDGGLTFTTIPGTSGAGAIVRNAVGAYVVLGEGRDGSDTVFAISQDGLQFTRTTLPAGSHLPAL
jgi:hypothetical protein